MIDEYPQFEPPFPFESFEELTRADAKSFFDWYVNVAANERSEILYSLIGIAPEPTPESLVVVWSRVMPLVTWRDKTEKEMEKLFPGRPSWLRNVGIERRDLTTRSDSFAVDIGFHVARVFWANIPGAEWVLESRRYSNQNQPVLAGFGSMRLNPPLFVTPNMWRVEKGQATATDLLNLYGNRVRDYVR